MLPLETTPEIHEARVAIAEKIFLQEIAGKLKDCSIDNLDDEVVIETSRIAYRMADLFNRSMTEMECHYDEIYEDEV